MTPYIIKSTFCLITLIGFYYVFLRSEKLLKFNRIFLLASLFFSLTIPLLSFELPSANAPIISEIVELNSELTQSALAINTPTKKTAEYTTTSSLEPINYIAILYLLGCMVFLTRFINNLIRLMKQIKGALIINRVGYKIALLDKEVAPSSFWKYIILNIEDYENNHIDNHLLEHEIAHIKQRHTLDIIIIELLHALFWFNPLIVLYKKSIKETHEYLADSYASIRSEKISDYQNTLLNFVFRNNSICLASSFNYSLTKKRLIMLTKTKKSNWAFLKMLFVIPLSLVLVVSVACTDGMSEKVTQSAPKEDLKGWFQAGSKPQSYEMKIEQGVGHDGNSAAIIKSIDKKISGFGTLMQSFDADKYLGKRVKMSGWVKSENVDDWAGLWMRVDGASKSALSFDNMQDRAIKGTTEWKEYEIVLDVPKEATAIAFGALMSGTGQIWFDDINFEIVESSIESTSKKDNTPKLEPTNLSFDE